jgi:hypothetical protein
VTENPQDPNQIESAPAPSSPSPAASAPPRPGLSRRRLWVFRVIALAFGVLLAFSCLEAGTRIIMAARPDDIEELRRFRERNASGEPLLLRDLVRISPDPRLVYEFIPGIEGSFKDVPVRINAAGFRDPDRPEQKPPGTWRLAALGDSILFGWGVPESARLTDMLAAFLNDTATSPARFEVLNFGVPGYNTVMEQEVLRARAARYQPDAVLVLHCLGNDSGLPNFIRKPRPLGSLSRSYFIEMLRERSAARVRGDLKPALMSAPPGGVPPEFRFLDGEDNARSALRGIASSARALGGNALFLTDYYHLDPYLPPRNRPVAQDPASDANRYAKDTGFVVVRTLEPFLDFCRANGLGMRALWITDDDAHPNAVKNALTAREVYRVMVGADMLPDSSARRPRLAEHLRLWDEIVTRTLSSTTLPSRAREVSGD